MATSDDGGETEAERSESDIYSDEAREKFERERAERRPLWRAFWFCLFGPGLTFCLGLLAVITFPALGVDDQAVASFVQLGMGLLGIWAVGGAIYCGIFPLTLLTDVPVWVRVLLAPILIACFLIFVLGQGFLGCLAVFMIAQ